MNAPIHQILQKRYEEDFIEDGVMPEFIPSAALNQFVFNETTVDTVLQDLMDRGIHLSLIHI